MTMNTMLTEFLTKIYILHFLFYRATYFDESQDNVHNNLDRLIGEYFQFHKLPKQFLNKLVFYTEIIRNTAFSSQTWTMNRFIHLNDSSLSI